MFARLGRFVTRHWLLVIVAWAGFAWLVNHFAPRWDDITHDGDIAYLPARMSSVRGEQRLADAFPNNRARSQMVVVVERPDGALTTEDLAATDRLAARFTGHAAGDLPIGEVWTHRSEVVGEKLLSAVDPRAGQATLIVLMLRNEFMATSNMKLLKRIEQEMAAARRAADFPAGLRVGVTGSAAIGGDMLSSARESIENSELTTVILVVAILLLVYRAPLLVVVPLTAIVLSTAAAMDIVAIAAQAAERFDWLEFKVFKTTKIFIVSILFGSGTDFCLFLISRYREELDRGIEKSAALTHTIEQVGTALAASALTTIFGLGMMYFADFGKFRYSGPTIAVCLTVTLLASLTLAPAMLQALGRHVFWPFGVGPEAARRRQRVDKQGVPRLPPVARLWEGISHQIIRRPGLILVGSVALLLYPACAGFSVPISYNLLNELQADRPSVQGTRLLRRHFAAGDTGPLTVVAYQKQADFGSKAGEQQIARLTKLLHDIDGVASVRSFAEPLGNAPGYMNVLSRRGQRKIAAKRHPRTKETYLSQVPEYAGHVTRLDLILDDDPFSPRATTVLNRIDARLSRLSRDPASPWQGAEFDFVGTTAGKRDLQAVTESDQTLIFRLVTIAVLATIVVMLKRPFICLYLIASVVFSYLVTIGCTELAFQWIYGATFEGLD